MTTNNAPFSSHALKVQTLADFSKAVYAVQPWELSAINDPSPGANEAYSRLREQGWQPVDFDIPSSSRTYSSSSATFTVQNKMENGYYTNANAAALVAQAGNTLVLAFRGTNDYDEKSKELNPADLTDKYHPDQDHWSTHDWGSSDSMSRHYQYFEPLLEQLNTYIKESPEATHLYITGHSMGGAMAIEYMAQHPTLSQSHTTESVVFAAAPFVYTRNFLGFAHRKDYRDDARVLQIEIAEDPVVESWDIFLDKNRPGEVVRLYGNETMDTPDSKAIYTFRSDNHSMDYYQEMAHGIDQVGWQQILNQASTNQVVDVYVGGEKAGGEYIVSNQNDILNGRSFELVYGGAGNDVIYAQNNKLINGGSGTDLLIIDGKRSQFQASTSIADGESYISLTGSNNIIRFNGIERLQFSNTKLALDIEGNAGLTAKVLGAVFGANSIHNKGYVGAGLKLLDSGMSYEALIETALTAAGATTNEAIVELLYTNVVGSPPSPNVTENYTSLLENGMSAGALGTVAADHSLNTNNIDLIGLSHSGIEYV